MRLFLLLLSVTLNTSISAQVYKVVQSDGSILYTDTPHEGAESMSLLDEGVNVANSLSPSASAMPPPPPLEAKKPPVVTVTSPAPEATIRNNEGQLTISATSNQESPRYQLFLDGNLVASNTSGVFDLKNLERGTHTFSVMLTDNKGKTLAFTPPQTFYVHRASVFINRPR